MSGNLFINLFKYRPRPNRNPLEDFTTEALAYLLNENEELSNNFIDLFLGESTSPTSRKNIRIKTQYVLDTDRRIDLAIFWSQGDKYCSLFIENKVWSLPWEQETNDNNYHNQIKEYQQYQDRENKQLDDVCHFVALVSPYILNKNYKQQDQEISSYLGNFTWSQIKDAFLKHYKKHLITEKGKNHLISQFIEFLRSNKMAGFENFDIAELSSIKEYLSYQEKLYSLTQIIIDTFGKKLETFQQKLTRKDAWGEKNLEKHHGVIWYAPSSGMAYNASFWIFMGISTTDTGQGEYSNWRPNLLFEEKMIPDVQTLVWMWFKNAGDRNNFIEKLNLEAMSNIEENGFVYTLPDEYSINFINRKSLLHFIASSNQEKEIIKFLNEGIKTIIDKNTIINQAITDYLVNYINTV